MRCCVSTAAREQAVASGAQGLPQLSANASYKREQLGLKGLLQSQGVYDKVNALGPEQCGRDERPEFR